MRKACALIALALLLAGCGGDEHSDIKSWMKDS